jgi:putative ABC transport system permease protein
MMVHDLRYAIRLLRKTPATTMIGVLTIAIGVGANAAIFSVIRAVLLKPLPYANAERLAWIPTPTLRPNNRSVAEHEAEFLPAQPGDRGGGGGEARREE